MGTCEISLTHTGVLDGAVSVFLYGMLDGSVSVFLYCLGGQTVVSSWE